jgi:protein-tyrosine phosphatase
MHIHVLYGVDDGPQTIEGTIHMLKAAVEEGITDLIVTPHAYNPKYNVKRNAIDRQINELTDIVKQLAYPLRLHTGQEIHLHEHVVENILSGEAMTLAKSRYLLLELPFYTVPAYSFQIIQTLIENGYTPIIAHPEKNRSIAENPRILKQLIHQGALAQITAGSCTGHFGRHIQKTALQFVQANLVHCYGSDAHNVSSRPFLFSKGLDFLGKKVHPELVDILLENNRRILHDEALTILEPENIMLKKWWSLIG